MICEQLNQGEFYFKGSANTKGTVCMVECDVTVSGLDPFKLQVLCTLTGNSKEMSVFVI